MLIPRLPVRKKEKIVTLITEALEKIIQDLHHSEKKLNPESRKTDC